ncbi:MAG TPA: hypothetical protein VM598_08540 [Bdellovibrionota bacterium]|nr:hypothetical protein [Bdellovibrionota bacterium]
MSDWVPDENRRAAFVRVDSPDGKSWFFKETVRQEGSPAFDSLIYVRTRPGYFLRAPVRGHSREWGVEVSWKGAKLIEVKVEWGARVAYTYVFDVYAEKLVSHRKGW